MILNAFTPNAPLWATVLFTRKGSGGSGLWVGVFAWDPDKEQPVPDLQERVVLDPAFGEAQIWTYDKSVRGKCYEELLKLFNHMLLDIPEDFDLPALVDANEAIVYDYNNKQIFSKTHPLINGKPVVRPSNGKISEQGRWLSQADQYAKGPEGETEGPSGLSFL
jgi:hypothetical protein